VPSFRPQERTSASVSVDAFVPPGIIIRVTTTGDRRRMRIVRAARNGCERAAHGLLFALHATVVLGALAGPMLVLIGTVYRDGAWTVEPWRNIFADATGIARWLVLLRHTAWLALLATAISVTAGAALALVLFKSDARLRAASVALLLLAATVPLYVVAGSMLSIMGKEASLGSIPRAALIHATAYVPIVALVIGMALRSVGADCEELALVEGAGTLRVLIRVTLRMAMGGFVAAVVLVVLWTTTDYSVSDVLLVRTFAEEVYTQFPLRGRTQEPALTCVPQAVLFAALLWALRRGFLLGESVEGGAPDVGARRRFAGGRWRWPLSIGAAAAALFLVAGPVVSLVPLLHGSRQFLENARSARHEILTSIWTSLAAGVITTAVGVGIAWYIVRRSRWRKLLAACIVWMLAFPAPVLGIGLVVLFNRDVWPFDVYDSPAMLVCAYVARFLPVGVILLIPAVRAIPVECELAARVDGCGTAAVWRRVVWPMCLPTALVSMFAVVVLSLGELPCSVIVAPPGCDTIGVRFFCIRACTPTRRRSAWRRWRRWLSRGQGC